MRKFLKNVSLFIIVSFVLYFFLTALWIHYVTPIALRKNGLYPVGNKGFLHSRLIEVDTVENVDILFLGSSHAYRGFDTRIFKAQNLSTFNLGSPSQTPLQANVLTQRYLNQLNPKLVVYEVYPSIFQNDGVESALDFIANTYLDKEVVDMSLKVNHIKTYNALIYDVVSETFNLRKHTNGSLGKLTDEYISGGYVATSIQHNLSPINQEMRAGFRGKKWIIRDKQWTAFQKIMRELKNQNIPIVLLQAPVTKEAYQLYTNNAEMDSIFQSVAPYYNLNESMSMDDVNDFMDYHHLNQKGVNKMNEQVLKIISEETETLNP